ncbi:MAG: hypothetical protein MJ220_01425 [Bacilli bacterium]|nr:hypothetical protein [Bacilli bacterium]
MAVNAGANAAIIAASVAAANARRRRLRIARQRRRIIAKRRENGELIMSNELIGSFIGKEVQVVTAEGENFRGKLVAVEDNWIKLEEKKTTRIINTDIVSSIVTKNN